jgi:hypothetical protein
MRGAGGGVTNTKFVDDDENDDFDEANGLDGEEVDDDDGVDAGGGADDDDDEDDESLEVDDGLIITDEVESDSACAPINASFFFPS